jgi:hypothetical protein
MDVTTTLLLLAGTVAAAVPVAVAVAAYKGVFGSGKPQSAMNSGVVFQITTPTATSAPTSVAQTTVPESNREDAEVTMQPIQEAPAPFPEDSISPSSLPTTSTTSVPTDISAISSISSASTAGSPVLVIATPKRRRSSTAKRLPSTATTTSATPRRRRSPKKQLQPETVIAPATTVATIPEAPAEGASSSETSATTATAPQPSQQEA